MKLYGLTGGSGAGKSAAASMLTARGFGWVDADAVYRALCQPGSELLAVLNRAFGGVLTPEGALDRPRLAAAVFSDRAQLARLNEIVNPRIWAASQAAFEALEQDGKTRILYDAPTLFQAGFDRNCDAVIGVVAPREVRMARIMARDGLREGAAAARIDAQPDEAFYRERCRYILENGGDLAALEAQINALCRALDADETT